MQLGSSVVTGRARTIVVGTTATTLQPPALRSLVDVRAAAGGLRFTFDAGRLAKLLPASTPARDAELEVRGDAVVVVPSVPGRTLDAASTARALAASDRATVVAAGSTAVPSVTTAQLTALGIRERVSQFTTYYPPGQPRVVNIQRASSVIDGTILRAGETFSMNEALGERTIEKGYVAAPQISGNGFSDSVGGGISQVATMLYNGAFFAGLELVEHQPHSLYIDRYPLGREATISWGGPELIFRNDWPAAVLIKLDATEHVDHRSLLLLAARTPRRDHHEPSRRARRRRLQRPLHPTRLPRRDASSATRSSTSDTASPRPIRRARAERDRARARQVSRAGRLTGNGCTCHCELDRADRLEILNGHVHRRTSLDFSWRRSPSEGSGGRRRTVRRG